jgi:hypothetical protein
VPDANWELQFKWLQALSVSKQFKNTASLEHVYKSLKSRLRLESELKSRKYVTISHSAENGMSSIQMNEVLRAHIHLHCGPSVR